jgi:DNA-binding transcriptional MerR regulator
VSICKIAYVPDDTQLTIDELARQVGMTVRNVRAHQSRGLLPPPEIVGRTGFYGPEHVDRLELVKDLQAEGFSLDVIKRILARAPGANAAEVLSFTRAVAEPFVDEQPELMQADELAGRWGDQITPDLIRRVEKLGFVRPVGDGRYEVLSPRLQRVSEELAGLGIPLETAVDITATVKRHAQSVANAYVALFLEHVWRPFEHAGEPEDQWGEVRESLDQLRPMAVESLVAIFGIVMTQTVEKALERELSRLGREVTERRPRRGRKRRPR